MANAKTAGVARWIFLALWGVRAARGEAAAIDYVTRVYDQVVIQPRDAREASDVYYKQRRGDVLLTYENEAVFTNLVVSPHEQLPFISPDNNVRVRGVGAGGLGGHCALHEAITSQQTAPGAGPHPETPAPWTLAIAATRSPAFHQIQCPVALVDRNLDEGGPVARHAATAFVNYLYTTEAQRHFTACGFRSQDPELAAATDLPAVKGLWTVEKELGTWAQIIQRFFSDGVRAHGRRGGAEEWGGCPRCQGAQGLDGGMLVMGGSSGVCFRGAWRCGGHGGLGLSSVHKPGGAVLRRVHAHKSVCTRALLMPMQGILDRIQRDVSQRKLDARLGRTPSKAGAPA